MSQEHVFKVLSDIALVDSTSYWIVSALALLASVILRAMLPVKMLASVFAPFMFWGGLTGIYAFTEAGMVLSNDKAANVVVTSTFGMIAALLVLVLLTRLVEAVTRIRTPLTSVTVPAPRRVRI